MLSRAKVRLQSQSEGEILVELVERGSEHVVGYGRAVLLGGKIMEVSVRSLDSKRVARQAVHRSSLDVAKVIQVVESLAEPNYDTLLSKADAYERSQQGSHLPADPAAETVSGRPGLSDE